MTAFGQEQVPTEPVAPTQTDSTDVNVQPKPQGTIRIGIVAVKTKLGQDDSGQEASEAIRGQWISYLSGPTVEVVAIEARISVQINIEAEQKGCDFVLYSSLSKKSKLSIFGNLIKVVVPVLTSQIPTSGNADPNNSDVNTTQQTVTQAGTDIANNMIAAKTVAKDVITLDFNLMAVNGATPTLKNSLKAKAKSDGEDVFSPLIEQAAGEVLQAAMKK